MAPWAPAPPLNFMHVVWQQGGCELCWEEGTSGLCGGKVDKERGGCKWQWDVGAKLPLQQYGEDSSWELWLWLSNVLVVPLEEGDTYIPLKDWARSSCCCRCWLPQEGSWPSVASKNMKFPCMIWLSGPLGFGLWTILKQFCERVGKKRTRKGKIRDGRSNSSNALFQ